MIQCSELRGGPQSRGGRGGVGGGCVFISVNARVCVDVKESRENTNGRKISLYFGFIVRQNRGQLHKRLL